MLECPGCHRHVRVDETNCPFCATRLISAPAPAAIRSSVVAVAAGLTLLACSESGDDAGDGNTVTSNASAETTLGDGDGDPNTMTDYSGADYGGPEPCAEYLDTIPIALGSNAVDTTNSGNDLNTNCGEFDGGGPDQALMFMAPATGDFNFAITGATFDAWLLELGYYCDTYGADTCVANQALQITLSEGEYLHLVLDGSAGGMVSIDVTQLP